MKKTAMILLCAVLSGLDGVVGWAEDDPAQQEGPPDAQESLWEMHGVLKNESALLTRRGQVTGQANATTDKTQHDRGTRLKFENVLTLHINRSFSETTSLHTQLNVVYEAEGLEGKRTHQAYSQNDYVREFYLDTTVGEWDVRLGKQQEVWGTADGIKLLDIVNPTDYREFSQNTMANARIPVWMLKSSTSVGGTGNLQFLFAQPKDNHIPGLNAEGDAGDAFIMKGVDAITGRVNGFLKITPALGKVAESFNGMAGGNLAGMSGADRVTVQNFIQGGTPFNCPGISGAACLNQIAQGTNQNKTRLTNGTQWDQEHPQSAFEYMNNATFATFGSFVGAQSAYRRDYPEDYALNIGMRYKNSIGGNLNYSLNYLNHYDPNPYVVLSWADVQGNPLRVSRSSNAGQTTLRLTDAAGGSYGGPATLLFTEKMKRINSMGGSFDTSMESGLLGPVVLRGEAVYQLGVQTPVVDRDRLSQGDLVGALQSQGTDMLKYVLGAEFIAFTNLTIGGQFIQFINLDYVDQAGNGTANSGRYTADQAVMGLFNGLQKGVEYKNFGSLFLSKPVGTEQQGRINNLTLSEERGGWWNRLDGEWKLNDEWVATAEWNQYWGNENTLFGQFGGLSNVQVGLKYLF